MASNLTTDIENLCTIFDEKAGLTTNDQIETTNSSSNVQFHRPLTISTLAHYFGLQCDEYLRLSLNSKSESKSSDNFKDFSTKQRGINFESNIKSYHSSSILSNISNENEFLSYLRSSIISPDEFRIGYNIKFRWSYDKNLQSNYKPDFLLIKHLNTNENRIEITVADAKSSSRMRIEHCIQVALYAIDLRIWIERNQLDQHVFINDFGEIWLPSENNLIPYEKKIFPMIKLQERIRYFLKYDFDQILKGNEWIMLSRCSMCPFDSHCRQRAISDEPESINNLSYLTRSTHSLIDSFFGSTSLSSMNLELLFNPINNEDLHSDEKTKLQKILSIDPINKTSAFIQALQTHQPQLKQQTSLLIPKINDNLILLFIFIIPNPSQLHSLTLFAYNIYDTSKKTWFSSQSIIKIHPKPSEIVLIIGQALDKLREYSSHPCQIIVFDEQEKLNLFDQLTQASDNEYINQCLVLLGSSENAILLEHPPDVIQTDRLFRSHALSKLSKDQIEEELYQHYGSSNNNNSNKKELTQQLRQLNEKEQEQTRQNLVGLPCLISLHTAIRQSFIIPTPGYFNLEDLKKLFQISLPSLNPNEILESIDKPEINKFVQEYFHVLAELYLIIQNCLFQSNRLQLNAYPLPEINRINSSHSHIRRLIFLRQYEMLYSLRSYQQTRFELNEPPILVQIINKKRGEKNEFVWECQIEYGHEIISKNLTENLNNNNTNDFRTYIYLISKDKNSIRTFSDALYMDSFIDGLRSRSKLGQCGLAHVEQKTDHQTIFIYIKHSNLSLEINEKYYLSERYVDFNTKKAIQALEQATVLTIQILDDPRQLKKPQAIQKTDPIFQQSILNMFSKREAVIKPQGLHILNKAQQMACEKVKNERVTLIWGPPGTGKTYWSGVTIFQMLMFSLSPLKILITACTHTAIDHLLSSIKSIQKFFSSSPQFDQWYQLAEELSLLKIDSTNFGDITVSYGKRPLVVGSTVWTLQKLDPSYVFDIIFIDEATQLLTSDAVLAINRLANHDESRLIVAGDPLQLPPIKQCSYPPLPHPVPDLFSSIFHCLLRDQNNNPISLHTEKPFEQISRCPYLAVFDENHRMDDQLSDFTRLLYGEHYRQGRSRPLLSIRPIDNLNSYVLGNLLEPYSSLYTILVDSLSSSSSSSCSLPSRSEDLVLESDLVYSLVNELIQRISPSSIFIITPHRVQRSAIKKKLSKDTFSNVLITCDTVEKMQGKEAQCVILCMLYRQREILDNELDFIYNRQRINVSITRAQQLCIFLTSQLLFNQPPFEVFVNENTRNAYSLLNNYVNKSTRRYLDNYGNIK